MAALTQATFDELRNEVQLLKAMLEPVMPKFGTYDLVNQANVDWKAKVEAMLTEHDKKHSDSNVTLQDLYAKADKSITEINIKLRDNPVFSTKDKEKKFQLSRPKRPRA